MKSNLLLYAIHISQSIFTFLNRALYNNKTFLFKNVNKDDEAIFPSKFKGYKKKL